MKHWFRALLLTFAGVSFVAVIAPAPAQAGILKKMKKKVKKAGKAAKSATSKTVKKARKDLKKAGKSVNAATGVITGTIDKAYDLTASEISNAVRTAVRELDRLANAVAQFITSQVTGQFKTLYGEYMSDYINMTKALYQAQPQFMREAQTAGIELLAGNFRRGLAFAHLMKNSPAMRPVIDLAKAAGFGSFVVYADAGASTNNLAAGGGTGLALSLTSNTTKIFAAASGAMTTEAGPSAGIGISIGFMRGSPSNIKGETIDVSGTAQCDQKGRMDCTVALSWTAPKASMKVPFVKASLKPAVYLFGVGTGVGGSSHNASLGATKAWVLQTIR